MRAAALKDVKRRTYYDKQRGSEKTIFKVMALNDVEGGDIGYLFFSNAEKSGVELPTLEEKVKFTELKGL